MTKFYDYGVTLSRWDKRAGYCKAKARSLHKAGKTLLARKYENEAIKLIHRATRLRTLNAPNPPQHREKFEKVPCAPLVAYPSTR